MGQKGEYCPRRYFTKEVALADESGIINHGSHGFREALNQKKEEQPELNGGTKQC